MSPQSRLTALAHYYSTLNPERIATLGSFYEDDVHFKDPFNEVRGIAAVQAIFRHMYTQVDEPRFEVLTQVGDDEQGFLTWAMHFRFRGQKTPQVIRGATHVRFGASGRIALHRDYWDAAEELYEKLPVLGTLMRWLRRRGAA